LRSGQYAGCNLLIAGSDAAVVVEFGDGLQVTNLSPGLHLITNGPLNDPHDRRIARVRSELQQTAARRASDWAAEARRVCSLRKAGGLPPICLEGTDRGTVSSTVMTLGERAEECQYWYADGPPTRENYTDCSRLLCRLLSGKPAGHRIHLRGPWTCEVVVHTDGRLQQSQAGPSGSATPPATVQLPGGWSSRFGTICGRVVLRRRFHGPRNLDPSERVFVLLEGARGTGTVSVNGEPLGTIGPESREFAADVTRILVGNDELRVDIELQPTAGGSPDVPPWDVAALEIRPAD
jgi:hypothetical protein